MLIPSERSGHGKVLADRQVSIAREFVAWGHAACGWSCQLEADVRGFLNMGLEIRVLSGFFRILTVLLRLYFASVERVVAVANPSSI
jgi:hypothetical protein